MFRRKIDNKAQVVGEYAFLIALIVAVLVGFQLVGKRTMSSKMNDAFNHTPAPVDVGGRTFEFSGGQFESGAKQSLSNRQEQSNSSESITGGKTSTKVNSTLNATENTEVGWFDSEEATTNTGGSNSGSTTPAGN